MQELESIPENAFKCMLNSIVKFNSYFATHLKPLSISLGRIQTKTSLKIINHFIYMIFSRSIYCRLPNFIAIFAFGRISMQIHTFLLDGLGCQSARPGPC